MIGQGVWILWGSKIAISHWQSQSPLTQSWRYRAARDLLTHELENTLCLLEVSKVLLKKKEFSRSQAVTYTVNMMIFPKRCKIEMLLKQSTNKKWLWPIDWAQRWWPWVTFNEFSAQLCSCLQDLNWPAVFDSSAISELLVSYLFISNFIYSLTFFRVLKWAHILLNH